MKFENKKINKVEFLKSCRMLGKWTSFNEDTVCLEKFQSVRIIIPQY